MNREPTPCPICGAPTSPKKTGRLPIYCSTTCVERSRYGGQPRPTTTSCQECGGEFPVGRHGLIPLHCSDACRRRHIRAQRARRREERGATPRVECVCESCGDTITPSERGPLPRFCSEDCRRHQRATSTGPRPTTVQCRTCHATIDVKPMGAVPVYCGRACRPANLTGTSTPRTRQPVEVTPATARLLEQLRSAATGWRAHAACIGVPVAVFFPTGEDSGRTPKASIYDQARPYCQRCPVIDECAADAAAKPSSYGYRAGMTPRERAYGIRQQVAS